MHEILKEGETHSISFLGGREPKIRVDGSASGGSSTGSCDAHGSSRLVFIAPVSEIPASKVNVVGVLTDIFTGVVVNPYSQ